MDQLAWWQLSPGFFAVKVAWKHLSVVGLAGAIEAVTGLPLIFFPQVLIRLLFGTDVMGVGLVLSRLAGIALLALGLGCFLGRQEPGRSGALAGMLTYNVLVTIYLAFVGLGTEFVGVLLWPAAALHAALTALLAHLLIKTR